jgi:hypothetical protein
MKKLNIKSLLVLIVVATWGVFLHFLFIPMPVQAQSTSNGYAVTVDQGEIIVIANGKISVWQRGTRGGLSRVAQANL